MKVINKIMMGSILLPILTMARCPNITYDITTGGTDGTYIKIGRDLAKYVAPDACMKLNVLASKGSIENVQNLISPNYPNLKFAIVQNDVLQNLKRDADNGDQDAIELVNALRVIKPLYNEEIHIITTPKTGINSYADLKGKRLSIGKPKSGTAMTSLLLYKELFKERLESKNYKLQAFDTALDALENNEIDAIIKVAGQPVDALKMTKKASSFLKLVEYHEKSKKHENITSYDTAQLKAEFYPWVDKNINTLTTTAFLVTYNYTKPATLRHLKNFVKSLNKNLPNMKNNATENLNTPHPKWEQVPSSCMQNLPGGWKYHDVVIEVCTGNKADKVSIPTPVISDECSEMKRATGRCK